ncbi:DHS-like NAD/FAD-binding domain-containing protein [Phlyctochytrium arcticum]|nr:DHS-like NAD/FAD-binding domain-containing protein [Phlyctochytrium arcticum]
MTVRFRVDQEGGQEHFVKLANSLWRSKRCVVVTGAGISVSGGIPDFRSADGLYNLVKAKYPDVVVKGKDLFDATLFKDPQSTSLFYTFMAELKGVIQQATTTPTHHFVKNLDERGQLLRCYTQNIDCLELRLQMSCDLSDKQAGRIVQLHGDLDHVVCTMCQALFKFHDEYRAVYREGDPPECPQCVEMDGVRLAAGKRPVAVGTLRPNIVLYNEHHSRGDQIADMAAYDVKRRPDMLIVMGTSLKVVGIKRLVKDLAKTVHDLKNGVVVFINNAEVGSREWDDVFDYHIMGMTDDVVQDLEMEMKKMDISAQIRAQRLAKGKEQRILASIQTQSAAAAVMTSVGVACIGRIVVLLPFFVCGPLTTPP